MKKAYSAISYDPEMDIQREYRNTSVESLYSYKHKKRGQSVYECPLNNLSVGVILLVPRHDLVVLLPPRH